MAGIVFFGSKEHAIGIFEPPFYKCPNCQELHTTFIVVYSTYYHVYWIPVFPYEREAVATCSECGFRRSEIKFGPALIKEFHEKKRDFKHPWWTYTLTLVFALLFAMVILANFLWVLLHHPNGTDRKNGENNGINLCFHVQQVTITLQACSCLLKGW